MQDLSGDNWNFEEEVVELWKEDEKKSEDFSRNMSPLPFNLRIFALHHMLNTTQDRNNHIRCDIHGRMDRGH